MMDEAIDRSPAGPGPTSGPTDDSTKKPYLLPQLIKRGSVVELTQGGGSVIDDGAGTLEGHV